MRRERRQPTRAGFLGTGVRIERDGGLIYVYLDTPEAARLAPRFLPPTWRGIAPDGCEVWAYRDPEWAA